MRYRRRCRRHCCCPFNLICLVQYLVCIFSLTLILLFIHILYTILIYNHFLRTFTFSQVPFWKDDRIINQQQQSLLPILQINEVNLSNQSIVIAACCRNVRKNLNLFQKNIQTISNRFGNYHIYLGESYSTDQTLTFLYDWQTNDSDHVHVYTQTNEQFYLTSRTVRIASCRNRLLEEIYKNVLSFDYYFVIDVDVGASASFEIKDFLSNFVYPSSSWIAMTATQQAEYYDIWALRIHSILPFDCWKHIDQLTSFFLDQTYLIKHLVKIHQQPIPRSISLIEVQSAFGGAALYDGKYLNRKCFYDGKDHTHWWSMYSQCEHVPFHYCLQKYSPEQKIYINPQFQIC